MSTSDKSSSAPLEDEKEIIINPQEEEEKEDEQDEASAIAQYNLLKTAANSSFAISDLDAALTGYERALGVLPSSKSFEAAVVRSNMAACYVRMEDWKKCVEVCGKGLDELDLASGLDPTEKKDEKEDDNSETKPTAEQTPKKKKQDGVKEEDILRIRTKLLLRRAKARTEIGGWADLHGAQDDYTQLSKIPGLSTTDQKAVSKALATLAPKVEEVKTKELGEMMGKLKQLGNGILKPFGLSTDNFNMVKDENSGGYSLSFQQGNGNQ